METVKSTSDRHDYRSFIEIKPYGPVPLACATCRYRKSRCDKTRPRCGRCVKFGIDCVYPGPRKSPLRKQTNAQELEDRLAQVEDQINKARHSIAQKCHSKGSEKREEMTDPVKPGNLQHSPQFMTFRKDSTLPLYGIMESLTETFFRLPYSDTIIIHPARYMQAFRGAATQKPPQYLQYAICALAAIGNSMDDSHHFFYQRARENLEAVNSKVPTAKASRVWIKANPSYECLDEQHVSIHHAQAWILISLYEDKAMLFTRAIMSLARTRQICLLMGLDLLDSEHRSVDHELSLLSWVELEECRRVFWCSFVLDAFASMSTGLPSLIDMDNVAIRLPASDDSFISEVQEETSFLHTILEDAQLDGFAGIVMLCQVFKDILRHTIESSCAGAKGRGKGRFWSRHHEIDERISRISKLLPGNLSLPPDPLDPPNIRINLTLQASIICLHHSAIKECKQHDSLQNLAQTSISCLQSAAKRAMDIIKSLPNSTSILVNTLCSLSLYLVTTALVFMAKQGSVSAIQDLGVIVSLMEKISPTHKLTRVFLHQVRSDINLSGIGAYTHIPASGKSTLCTNQTTPPSSGSVSSHNTASQDVRPSSMKQRNLAAWAVEDDPGSLAWDCFSALLAPARHNASAANKTMGLNRDRCHVSSIGNEHMMSNDTINAVSRHGPAMIGNQLIDANEVQQDHLLPSTLTAEELMVLDDPLSWAGSWETCDNDPEGTFDSAPHYGSTALDGIVSLQEREPI